jgi:hypothetical protein
MAKTTVPASATDDSTIEIDLKDPRLAAFLAWLVPGLGHIYQGRTGKGVLFFVCIVGTFFYGMYIGSGRVVYASTANVFSWKFFNDRWQYACQAGVGLPALPAIVQRARMRNNEAPLSFPIVGEDFMRPPRETPPDGEPGFISVDQSDPSRKVISPDELAKWNYDLGENFEIGTVFTVIAGLLNVLVIFDAYGGPLILPPGEEQTTPTEKNKKA